MVHSVYTAVVLEINGVIRAPKFHVALPLHTDLGFSALLRGRACFVWQHAYDRACQSLVSLGCVVQWPAARCRGSQTRNSIDCRRQWNRKVRSRGTAADWIVDCRRDCVLNQSTVHSVISQAQFVLQNYRSS